MSNIKLLNPRRESPQDKAKRLNQEIDNAVIKRITQALERNDIKDMCSEIEDHPDIIFTELNYRGRKECIYEHVKYAIKSSPKSQWIKLTQKITTLKNQKVKSLFLELFEDSAADPSLATTIIQNLEFDQTAILFDKIKDEPFILWSKITFDGECKSLYEHIQGIITLWSSRTIQNAKDQINTFDNDYVRDFLNNLFATSTICSKNIDQLLKEASYFSQSVTNLSIVGLPHPPLVKHHSKDTVISPLKDLDEVEKEEIILLGANHFTKQETEHEEQ